MEILFVLNQRDLFCLLDVDNIKIVEEIKVLIYENFYLFCDFGLLYVMVEYYLKICLLVCLQILSGIYEVCVQVLGFDIERRYLIFFLNFLNKLFLEFVKIFFFILFKGIF